jgi:hypothetical protein
MTWVRSPEKFCLPVKYGWRECFYLTNDNAGEWEMVDVDRLALRNLQAHRLGIPDAPLSVVMDALMDAGLDSDEMPPESGVRL